MEDEERSFMALLKTVGVIILLGVALWIVFGIIGFLAFAVWTLVKILIIAAIVGAIYHHFAHKKRHTEVP
jgi:hypothetical protein